LFSATAPAVPIQLNFRPRNMSWRTIARRDVGIDLLEKYLESKIGHQPVDCVAVESAIQPLHMLGAEQPGNVGLRPPAPASGRGDTGPVQAHRAQSITQAVTTHANDIRILCRVSRIS
jgi:hypothetical protein